MTRFEEILATLPESLGDRGIREAVQRVLAAQGAVISGDQLKTLGLSADRILRRVDRFELFEAPIARDIYTGQAAPLTPEGRRWAGLLWAPPETALTGVSSTALLGLERSRDAVVQLVTHNDSPQRRRAPGVILHRTALLPIADLTTVGDLPCTRCSRAILDAAHKATPRRLDSMIKQAEDLRIYDHASMHRLLDEHPKFWGRTKFAEALERVNSASDEARSLFERKTAELLRSSPDLPEILVNAVLLGVESDLWLYGTRVVIECDGRRFHRTPAKILRDAERDRILRAGGFAILRLLWDQVVYEPERTLRRVVDFYRAHADPALPPLAA